MTEIEPEVLKDHLELVLALLCTRASEDRDIRGLVAPAAPVARALARTVEKIIDLVSQHQIPIRSRIELEVDKPAALDRTPDLLYALRLYLTGDAGAQAIRVMAVRGDED